VSLGLLVLRCLAGLLILGHASHKFFGASHRVMGFAGGMGPRGTAEYMESVGMKPGMANVVVAGLAELVSGLLLILGVLTPLAGALMIAVLTVALLVEHLPKGMWESNGGVEYPLLLAVVVFALAGTGPGSWSLAHAADIELAGWRWAVGALVVGLAGAGAAFVGARIFARRGPGALSKPAGV